MAYYIAKGLQAAALIVTAVGFLKSFPKLMDTKILGTGIGIFLLGWLVDKYFAPKG